MTEQRSLAIFVTGAAVSNAGSFMQATAVPFVLFELTDSNAWVGAGVFATLAMSVVVAPVAGIAIDRFSQKRVLMAGQVVQMVAAIGLWLLAVTDSLDPWPILLLVALGGIGSGLQFPAAQSFTPTIVSPERLPSAVRLTTFGLTVSRTIGPALGGLILALSSPSVLFALNGATFVIYLTALCFLHPRRSAAADTTGKWIAQYRATLTYIRDRPSLGTVLRIGLLGAVFGTSIVFLVPGIADLYGAGAAGVGALTSVYGIGAIVGSTLLLSASERIERSQAARVGFALFGLGGLLAVATTDLGMGLAAFAVMGLGYSLWLTSVGTALQVQLSDKFRGRVTVIYVCCVVGGTPVGAVIGGVLGDQFGLRPTVAVYGAILLTLAAIGPIVVRFSRLDTTLELPVPTKEPLDGHS